MCTDCLDQPGTRHNVSFTHFVTTSHYTRFQIQHLVKGETVFNNMLLWCTFADYCSNFSLFIKIKLTNFHHRAAGCTTRPGGGAFPRTTLLLSQAPKTIKQNTSHRSNAIRLFSVHSAHTPTPSPRRPHSHSLLVSVIHSTADLWISIVRCVYSRSTSRTVVTRDTGTYTSWAQL